MSGVNSFGRLFCWTTFGESHGPGLGVVIDGCPAGVPLSKEWIQAQLDRRRPGQTDPVSQKVIVSARAEEDRVEILSGVHDGITLGTPIACFVKNQDQRPEDYHKISQQPRQGHADDVWKKKFGLSDLRGGGRASGRETLSRVIAGAVAQSFVRKVHPQLRILGFVDSIGQMKLNDDERQDLKTKWTTGLQTTDAWSARFPTTRFAIADFLLEAKEQGESYGGVVELWADGLPTGLGEPVFYKLKNALASAMMSIGATCGFEIGGGFDLASRPGTEVHSAQNQTSYGGQRGGISTGEPLSFRTAFKPTSSIMDVAKKGRHDPCIVPRAVPVIEAMTWATLADMILHQRLNT